MNRGYTALAALALTGAALLPPMHDLAHDLFAWHMVQHLVLVFGVAPLVAVSLPDGLLASVPRMWFGPVIVVILHAVALWAWHLPIFYDTALDVAPLHALEHALFVATAALFWVVVLGRTGLDHLRRAGMVFVTGLQSAALGAVLVFASTPLYDSHLETTAGHGLTPLEDQQLAGGIMWIPPGVAYLVITLVLFQAGMKSSGRDDVAVAGDRSGT